MMMGNSRVRGWPRQNRARAWPLCPGNIQSRTTRLGNTPSTATWACSASPAIVTSKPAWRRLMEISSAIADSSSTTRIRLISMVHASLANESFHHAHGIVANVGALDDVDDLLGQV